MRHGIPGNGGPAIKYYEAASEVGPVIKLYKALWGSCSSGNWGPVIKHYKAVPASKKTSLAVITMPD
jgi:hypothetical protein